MYDSLWNPLTRNATIPNPKAIMSTFNQIARANSIHCALFFFSKSKDPVRSPEKRGERQILSGHASVIDRALSLISERRTKWAIGKLYIFRSAFDLANFTMGFHFDEDFFFFSLVRLFETVRLSFVLALRGDWVSEI